MNPEQYVQNKAAASGSSFYYAFLFLPRDKRAAITAFYAFCREVDDVVDEVRDPGVAAAKLDWWRSEVEQAFDGQPSHPAMRALMPHVGACAIERQQLLDIIEGCQMDLRYDSYEDFAGLANYCHYVAGVVGEVSARIFGQQDKATSDYAHKLGLALQLTNIIRDVGEDVRRGRVYLPQAELREFGVTPEDLAHRRYGEAFTRLMRFQAERAHRSFDEALSMLPAIDRRSQKPGLMMASIYRTLLREIEAEDFQVLHQRIALTPLRKLWLAWKVQALGKM
ncbi:presqualene diphosphate synthase HpnD [Comamonas sp. NLF-1-9]|uniref:presqualene diphosphate synthase HpnD n=1 Tax=Comamonas sp. NLF-1-9 TaxID=2853163 RepID=UPI001C45D5DF|nr:presqualene diphosphate synthase HpnD [Comamonas sp. NLF-1-9]QXL85265.1 presqualene diphosphate synthase HpnD [Comamonas sp. NLF-1-9]